MINVLKSIKEKTDELESAIEKLHKNSLKTYKSFKTIRKQLLNLSILTETEIELFDNNLLSNSNIYLTCKVDLYLPSTQNIEFALLVNNICISKSLKSFSHGYNEILLNSEYTSLLTGKCIIKLRVVSVDKKQVELKNITLNIYGIQDDVDGLSYQAINIYDEKLLLSFLDNNELYYLITDKSQNYYNKLDFVYYTDAISYSFCFNKNSNDLYLFIVDVNNNLILTIFNTLTNIILNNNVTYVSSSFGDNTILVCYIQNNKCKYFTIENGVIENQITIEQFSNIKYVNSAYNKINNKFYIILTDINNQNYLIESINERFKNQEKITATINFNIAVSEANDEI